MTEQFEEMMCKTSRDINVGYLSALFDMAIECIAKIAIDERISGAIHKAINPMLDKMIDELYSMKNNTMATIMFANDEKMKVVQSTRADIIRSLYCDTCENKNEGRMREVCGMCSSDSETRPSCWKPRDAPRDCDEGRICPKCGKVMILCEDEKTYHQIWECDGCGHKEEEE